MTTPSETPNLSPLPRPDRARRARFSLCIALWVGVGLAGCGDGEPEGGAVQMDAPQSPAVEPVDPTTLDYAGELDIDFSTMERTETGLYYRDDAVGDGETAEAGRQVEMHYTGYHPDGRVFDTSRERESGLVLTLGQGMVIEGWEQGIPGMREGGRRLLVIPPELGYGAQGAGGGVIPPNAVLVFEVELVAVR